MQTLTYSETLVDLKQGCLTMGIHIPWDWEYGKPMKGGMEVQKTAFSNNYNTLEGRFSALLNQNQKCFCSLTFLYQLI